MFQRWAPVYILLNILLAWLFCSLVGMMVEPVKIADYSTYVGLIEKMRMLSFTDLLTFEPLSRGLMLLSIRIFGDSSAAISMLHFVNITVFLILFSDVCFRYARDWRNIALVFSLFGPLLALVTIRATPAYLLLCYAYFNVGRCSWKALLLCFIAIGFHMSALLALPPMLLAIISTTKEEVKTLELPKVDIAITLLALLVYLNIRLIIQFVSILISWLNGLGPLDKFSVYLTNIASAQSIFHRLYFVGCFCIVIIACLNSKYFSRTIIRYLSISFLSYATLCISPVAAFRESIFWIMPLLLVFPLKRYINSLHFAFLFFIGCCALCCFSLYEVIL